jgi:eukaryotic-like serine/threonine-protein kinase
MRLPNGTKVGFYEIVAPLGSGGMGVVYRAMDTRLNRPVAIKFISDEQADAAARLRFQREAQMASALNHPHILTVYDAGEFEGRQYLVAEFLDGGTLTDWAKRTTPNYRQILELLVGIADGLATAHEAGILHRDIKPDNILISKSGYAKLADFGLAKLHENPASLDEDRTQTRMLTSPGVIVGTIPYVSPEQASGRAADARSDIFSFGVVVYELLAGRRPFTGASNVDVLHSIVRSPTPPLPHDVPLPMRLLIEKALEKDPGDRFQTMREMAIDLRRATRQTTDAHAAPVASQRHKHARNWLMIAAAIITVLVGGSMLFLRLRRSTDPARLEYTQLTSFADSAVAPAISPDGRMLAFIRGENTFLGPGEIYVKLLPDGEPVQLTHDGASKMGPTSFSPDGSRIAYTVGGRDTWTSPVLGGEPSRMLVNASGLTWIPGGPGGHEILYSDVVNEGIHMGVFTSTESRSDARQIYLPADVNGMAHRSFLSPDRRSLLVVEMDVSGWLPCRVVPFDGSTTGRPVGPSQGQCTDAAWSPDGRWMYFAVNTGNGFHIWRQQFPDGSPEQITFGATEEQGLAFDPDGRSFVTSVGESQSTLWFHDTRGERQITSQGYAYLPSFSSDNKRLYYLQRSRANRRFVSGELWVADVESGKRGRILTDFLMEHYSVAADGNHVVFVRIDDAGHSPIWIATLDGSIAPHRLVSLDCVRALFDPKGGVFFVGGERGSPFLWHVQEDGSQLRKLASMPVIFIYSVSPDGKAVALWVGDSVIVYPVEGGNPIRVCSRCATAGEENRGVTPSLVSWSPDGNFLYLHAATTRKTYVVPLRAGQLLPQLPAAGISSMEAAANLPGAVTISQQRAFVGPNPSAYAFPRVTTHRNIYRIHLP